MSAPGTERRRHRRWQPLRLFAHLWADRREVACHVTDVSMGGLQVTVRVPWLGAEQVRINLARPGWERALQLEGQWLAPHALKAVPGRPVRLAFVNLTEEAKRVLAQLFEGMDEPLRRLPPARLETALPLPEAAASSPPPPPKVTDEEVQSLKRLLASRDQSILELRAQLTDRNLQLAQALKDKDAAERAVERLCLQLSLRR